MNRPPNKHALLFHSSVTLPMLFLLAKISSPLCPACKFILAGKAVMHSCLEPGTFFCKERKLSQIVLDMSLCLEIAFLSPGLKCMSLFYISTCVICDLAKVLLYLFPEGKEGMESFTDSTDGTSRPFPCIG